MDKYLQNLHMHTKYCDGKNTPEEVIKKAIELGFDTIGFSGHSNTQFDIVWHMKKDEVEIYKKEIAELKEKYADKINVLCGLEYDIYSGTDKLGYDYVIGSVHFLKIGDEYVEFDLGADDVRKVIDTYFDGDGMKYAAEYYRQIAKLHEYGDFDIVGHFDIITKHCESHDFFDIRSEEYKNMALEALRELSKYKRVFEVNTGAISRGYRTTPYPAPFLLEEMNKLGVTVVLTSDCHNADHLDCYYKEALELIKSCGFKSIGVMRDGKIVEEQI